ncbi:hypothetical protein CHUAL_007303 [Chamberlinius hualienensis]
MNRLIVLCFAIACLIVNASAQSTESALCQGIESSIHKVMETCKPSKPPTDENFSCMQEAGLKEEPLTSIVESCAEKATVKEKAECFISKLEAIGCKYEHEH